MSERTPLEAARIKAGGRRWADPTLWLRWGLLGAFLAVPLLAPTFQIVDLALKIALFAALVASYDVVIGYTGIVSFGHAMFFGFGAYAVAMALGKFGAPTAGHLLVGFAIGAIVSAVVAVAIGAFSLRVKAIFFAMITLAFAEFAFILAVQWREVTGGEDGLSPRLPGVLAVAWDGGRVLGIPLTGRLMTYYLVLAVSVACFLLLR
ncbi:MAG TPA: branched-chain amino acid ABC transporter permease, partial [Methylomirabilota bacterium]|nr:branched-chain amino acid ABC transporter permease [Methylomirabilota bacterium]